MTYKFEFDHPTLLSAHRVDRAVKFIRQLDDLVATFQPPNSTPLSVGFLPLFNGQADADKGFKILEKMQESFKAPGFKRTNEVATNYFMCAVLIAFHRAVHALQANDGDESSDHMQGAGYMLGYIHCLILQAEGPWDVSWQTSKGAAITNSIYNATKKEVFEWCIKNRAKFASLHKASIAVATEKKIDPRTAKKYIKEWEAEE